MRKLKMKSTELEMIEKEAQNLQMQFDKHGDISDDVLRARTRSVASGIEAVETRKQQVAKKKLKWQDTLTKFVIGVYRRTHKNMLDSMKEALRVRRETAETFISADIDAFEESEADEFWMKPIPQWLQNYKAIDTNNRNISLAVKVADNNKVFDVFVLTSNNGEAVHFKFLTIKVSEDYIYINTDEFCPNITFSTEEIYKIVAVAVNRVNIMLYHGLPSQVDLAIRVSRYQIEKTKREMKEKREQAEKERDEALAKLKEQLGNFDN